MTRFLVLQVQRQHAKVLMLTLIRSTYADAPDTTHRYIPNKYVAPLLLWWIPCKPNLGGVHGLVGRWADTLEAFPCRVGRTRAKLSLGVPSRARSAEAGHLSQGGSDPRDSSGARAGGGGAGEGADPLPFGMLSLL